MPRYIAFHNGKFIDESDLRISPLDRGFLYGDGLFETLRAVERSIVSFSDHFERLTDGCNKTKITFPFTMAEIRHAIGELLVRNELRDATIRLAISRGVSDQFGFGFGRLTPTVVMLIRPVKKIPDDLYSKGVSVTFMNHPSVVTRYKTTSAQVYALAKQAALDNGSYETILTGEQDVLLEGTSSNVFLLYNGTAYTPGLDLGILPGVTRKRVIHLFHTKLDLPIEETSLGRKALHGAEEVFLTNTNVQILPVTKVDGTVIGQGRIGPITEKLIRIFRQTLVEILE